MATPTFYVEAYDGWNNQILGNLDGQGVLYAKNYRRTNHYKALPNFPTLNGCVKYYHIVSAAGELVEVVQSNTYLTPTKEVKQ